MGDTDVTQASIESFRDKAIGSGLSPATIEAVIYTVRRIVNFSNDQNIPLGRKLFVPKPSPDVPRMETIDAIYRKVSATKWPRKLNAHQRCDWWRAYIVLTCWTGFRISDVSKLEWVHFESDCVRLCAKKTVRYRRPDLAVPMTFTLRRHVNQIKGLFGDRVFGITKCLRQLRDELERIADAAKVPYVPPHGFRRFAVNVWTDADPLAGQLIQGCRLGAMDNYLDVLRHLSRVSSRVEMPDAFYTPAEIARRQDDELSLLQAYRAAKADEKRLLLDLARRLA